ncbi:MAG: acyl-CoA desaturase, partial [Candidatus Thermoplasmatota archaeon]|nr:acyl-CoA desaturase [Candidatus Thermoplasmatota archaeon]
MSDVGNSSEEWKLDLLNASFLCSTPILAIVGVIWYTFNYGISIAEISILFFMYLASGLSITAGYHRLFSHRSHSASWPLRLFYAIFGAAAFQNSAIKWCSDHRRHHLKTDSEEDPYSIIRGFFWAHMGWVMISEKDQKIEHVEDLQSDPILIWQDKHIFKIGGFAGIILPGLVGIILIGGFSGFLGGLIWGGLLRLVIVHHGTFLINSGAHYWGKQNYSTKNTSRDSPILSLLTFGEGYHNFHHTFQADYRNGHKWYHWDPTKWWIKFFSIIKITKNLHKIPSWTIEDAKMKTSFEHKEKSVIDSTNKDDFKKR